MNFTYDVSVFKKEFESNFTWLNGFMRNVDRFGYKIALFDPAENKNWTYEQLNKECNRFANAMKNSGIAKNDVVTYQLFNSAAFVFCYIAPQKIGAINNPVNYNLSPGETAQILNHNKPKVYVYDSEVKDMVLEALNMAEHKPEIIIMAVTNHKETECPEGHILFDDYIKNSSDENIVPENASIYDEVTRLQTSGTTGLPKGVPLNNINEVLSAHDVLMHFPLNPTDKTMNMTPWFHRGGLHSGGLTPTLYVGGQIIIFRAFLQPKLCLEYVEKYKITFLIGVPSVLEILANRQEKSAYDLSSLKGIVTMGSPLEKAACIRYQNMLTPNIFNGYGTTETFWNTFLRPYDLPKMSGAAGKACTDDDVRVVKFYENRKAEPDELADTDNKEVGEIIIKSPAKTTYCYYNNEEATQMKYKDGWFYTGDLGTWDKHHFITVAGRKDDMIISAGENIYPAKIEEVINEHEKVAECIVTAVPDKARGEAVTAYIIPKDKSLTVAELIDFCSNSPMLSKYQCPRYYRFVDELPRTATGKKQHFKIKAQAKEDLKNGLLLRK
ncbi:MAG: AMP-binding protein [Ruminococcus sp.]|nr:AMP-binding protein [Ruminococcus sp.]